MVTFFFFFFDELTVELTIVKTIHGRLTSSPSRSSPVPSIPCNGVRGDNPFLSSPHPSSRLSLPSLLPLFSPSSPPFNYFVIIYFYFIITLFLFYFLTIQCPPHHIEQDTSEYEVIMNLMKVLLPH
jgi:hypothetical protein